MEIRKVTAEDYAPMMELIAEFSEESLSEFGTYLDPEQLKKTYEMVWPTSFAAIVDRKVVGVFGGRIVEDFCSKRPVYEEIVWFMNKSHRKYGLRLLHYVEEWCRARGIDRLVMVAMHNSMTEKLFTLYGRLGFRPMETRFIKELD